MFRAHFFLFLLPAACAAPETPAPLPEPDGEVIWTGDRGTFLNDIQVSDTNVYWVDWGGDLFRYREDTEEVDLLQERASGFVVRENALFVASNVVERYDLEDLEAAPVIVAETFAPGNNQDASYDYLAVTEDWLYWTRPKAAPSPGEFGRTSLLDGTSEVLWTDPDNFRGLGASADDVFATAGSTLIMSGVEGNMVLATWSTEEVGVTKSGNPAIGDDFVFLILRAEDPYAAPIVRFDVDSGAFESLAIDQENPLAVALDGDHVLYTRNESSAFGAENSQGAIVRMRQDGSEREVIARYQQGPVDIDVNDHAIYWLNNASNEVRKLEKSDIGAYDPARAVEED